MIVIAYYLYSFFITFLILNSSMNSQNYYTEFAKVLSKDVII